MQGFVASGKTLYSINLAADTTRIGDIVRPVVGLYFIVRPSNSKI